MISIFTEMKRIDENEMFKLASFDHNCRRAYQGWQDKQLDKAMLLRFLNIKNISPEAFIAWCLEEAARQDKEALRLDMEVIDAEFPSLFQ